MEKKINLEEILIDTFPEEESGYSYNSLNNVTKAYIKKTMLEFGKQLLDLASENVKLNFTTSDRVGPPTTLSIPRIDKQSILDTIEQVNYEK